MAFNSGMSVPKKFGTVGTRLATLSRHTAVPVRLARQLLRRRLLGQQPDRRRPDRPAGDQEPGRAGGRFDVDLDPDSGPVPDREERHRRGEPRARHVANGRVTVNDRACASVKRTFATNASGAVVETRRPTGIGLPYSSYDLCADNGVRRQTATNIAVKDTTERHHAHALPRRARDRWLGTCP